MLRANFSRSGLYTYTTELQPAEATIKKMFWISIPGQKLGLVENSRNNAYKILRTVCYEGMSTAHQWSVPHQYL